MMFRFGVGISEDGGSADAKKLQLVLGAVLFTAIGKAKNVGQTFINADTKSILKKFKL